LGLATPRPTYVLKVVPDANTLVVGTDEELFSATLEAEDFNWVSGEVPTAPLRANVKIRYKSREVLGTAEAIDGRTVRITLDEPQRAITPGQAVVLYNGDEVLGGGVIR
jgi:tRNA-specific 2-thiouridylase